MSDIDEMRKLAIGASIWRPNSVDQEPETHLTNWAVFSVELEGGEPTIHFAGYTGHEGRVCSPVKTYDPVTKRGVTQSGRVYELVPDRPGLNGDAAHVWNSWLRINGNPKFIDVTELYL